jgi:hypothetical protein
MVSFCATVVEEATHVSSILLLLCCPSVLIVVWIYSKEKGSILFVIPCRMFVHETTGVFFVFYAPIATTGTLTCWLVMRYIFSIIPYTMLRLLCECWCGFACQNSDLCTAILGIWPLIWPRPAFDDCDVCSNAFWLASRKVGFHFFPYTLSERLFHIGDV